MKDQIFDATSIKVNPLDGYVVTVKGEPLHILGDVKVMKQNTVYMAESWFNDEQNALREAGMKAMKQNPTIDWENSFRPIEHQYKGWKITDHPDMLNNSEWQLATFRSDVQAMDAMDITIALYDPKMENSDPGVVWELGYVFGLKKPAFLVLPDDCDTPLNLMPALGATRVLHVSDLGTFNFNDKAFIVTKGEVY